MILGIISDTHDKQATVEQAFSFFVANNVSLVIHCGDWKSVAAMEHFAGQAEKYELPVRGVLGNNDVAINEFQAFVESSAFDFQVTEGVFEIQIGDRTMAIYHGHHVPTLRKVRADESYNALFLGHTHKPKIENTGSTIIVNPGSTAFSIPRSKLWQPTVALVDTNSLQATLHTI
jgi:putative phosphoesterase